MLEVKDERKENVIILDDRRFLPIAYGSGEHDENYLENAFFENYEHIFGKETVLFNKHMIKSVSGIKKIPDAFVIDIDQKKWYIVEVELSSHSFEGNILPQLNGIYSAKNNVVTKNDLETKFRSELENDKTVLYPFWLRGISLDKAITTVRDIVVKCDPAVVVVIEKRTKVIVEGLGNFGNPPRIIEFKVYAREDAPDVRLYLTESLIQYAEIINKKQKAEVDEIAPNATIEISNLGVLDSAPGKGKLGFNSVKFPDGKKYPLKYWKDLLTNCFAWLYETGKLTKTNYTTTIKDETLRKNMKVKGSALERTFREGKTVGDFEIETAYDQAHIVRLSKRVLAEFGIKSEEVRLERS